MGLRTGVAQAADFSQRTRFELSGGYNYGRHKFSHYSAPYGAPNTSTLLYARHRGEGRVAVSWSGFWKLRGRQGLYLRSVPAFTGGGGGQGNLNDKDFCDSSQRPVSIDISSDGSLSWDCPQELTTWSDTDSPVDNWFINAELDNAMGFFLQSPHNDERYLGAGLSFGYSFLHESDLARGLLYNAYSLNEVLSTRNQRPLGVLRLAGMNVIGNKLYSHAAKIGIELWTEQIPPRWRQPVILNLAVRFVPYTYFLQEDSHFLRDDLAAVPNIISEGTGYGAEVAGSLFVPFPVSRAPQLGWLLQAQWQRLMLRQGTDTFYSADGSTSSSPLTEFTTESFSVSTGFTLTW